MARLPTPGGDNGNWGTILNDYLTQAHKSDGTLKDNSVTGAAIAPNSVDSVAIANGSIMSAQLNAGSGSDGQVLSKQSGAGGGFVWSTVSGGGVSDATTTTKGVIQLAGDLSGTAAAPTVPGLAGKEPTVTAGTTAQYWRDKSWQTLNQDAVPDGTTNKAYTAADKTRLTNTSGTNTGDQDLSGFVPKTTTVNGHALSANVTMTKSDVGLGSVDNTSDSTKNSAVATLTNKDLTSGTNTFPTFNQSTTGNAATATKLATARNINGVAFDGTADISVDGSSEADYVVSVSGSTYTATPRVGSSLTAYSGANFSTVLQNAINALTPSGSQGSSGGKIHIGTGTFTFGNEVTITGWEGITGTSGIPSSSLVIEAEGLATKFIQNTSGQNGFVVKNCANVSFLDMYAYMGASALSFILGDSSGAQSEMSFSGWHSASERAIVIDQRAPDLPQELLQPRRAEDVGLRHLLRRHRLGERLNDR